MKLCPEVLGLGCIFMPACSPFFPELPFSIAQVFKSILLLFRLVFRWKSWKFSLSRNAWIREAGIEQATVATRCLGANSPEPRRRAVTEWHVITQKTSSYITVCTWLPGLIVGPCPSEESLCCPACSPALPFFADSRPRSLKLCVSFPCICSPPVCIIRSVTSLSLATTTWTPEHPFFSTHCYPNTPSDITCVLGGGSFPITAHGFSSKGVVAVRTRRLFPSTISGVSHTSGSKIRLTAGFEPRPRRPAPSNLAAANSPFNVYLVLCSQYLCQLHHILPWLSSITFFEGPSFLGLLTICISPFFWYVSKYFGRLTFELWKSVAKFCR